MNLFQLPFFDAIRDAKTVLIAGAGGGFDIYSGVPLLIGLQAAGKKVHLANLTFTRLSETDAHGIADYLFEVTHETEGPRYFPEVHLCRWLKKRRDIELPIYCVGRTGVAPVRKAYRGLIEHLGKVDAIILIDGGTDSLMRGDESGLGTPQEDIASICAVDDLEEIPTKLLVCIGFGVDTYHGVCHAQFLEAVADLMTQGAFLGAWSLTPNMPEAIAYLDAVKWATQRMGHHPSIVSTSVAAAVQGRFGDYHETKRTEGSRLFINPLMSLYWAFQLGAVARRNLYLAEVKDTPNYSELSMAIESFRNRLEKIKPWEDLPM